MVKNLSTIDRSTKVRLGRHATDDQADNTIVINASNAPISAQTPGSLYMTPLRTVPGGNTKILGYDPTTKEILNTNIDEPNIIAKVVDFYANIGNTFTSTIVFEGENGLITTGNVGISNTEPIHTLDVGSNLWVDDTGSTVLNVTGGVHIDGNLDVEGQLTVIESQNLRISDAIIEVGKGNTTADVGMMFDHQGSNVVVGYKDNELIMAHTQSSADQTSFTANTANPITAHVYGYLVTQSNVGVINTNPIHTLDVGSNLYVDDVASNVLYVKGATDLDGNLIVYGNAYIEQDLHVKENAYVTQDLTVTENVLVSNNLTVTKDLTVNNDAYITQDLTVTENVFVSNNITVTKDLEVVENVLVSNNLTVTKDVEVVENVLVSNNLTVTKDLTVNDNVYVTQDLTVTENVFVSNNLTVTKDLIINDNAYVTQDLTVTENVLVSNNLTVTKDMTINGNVFFSNNLTVAKDLTVNENALCHSRLDGH
jgi:UDP-3-O-[3-hydroxymyristoyl] glucosamine N-acyltransferase